MKLPDLRSGVLVLITLAVCAPGLFSNRDFWVEDEARYAEVIREMVHDGHWMVPYLNGSFYPDKPPVYFWLAAAVSMAMGEITVFSCLLITVLSTVASVLGVFYLGKLLYDPGSAFTASLVFLTTFVTISCAQIVRMDMLFTALIIWAIVSFVKETQNPDSRFLMFWTLSAVAVLVKGPLGMLFPAGAAICYSVFVRERRMTARLVFPGALIPFILSAVWLTVAYVSGEEAFVRDIFLDQLAGRAGLTKAPMKAFHHPQPWYFYTALLPALLLPWTPFLYGAVRRWKSAGDNRKWLLFWWFIAGLTIISLIRGKLFIYVLPIVPPVSLLIGLHITETFRTVGRSKTFAVEALIAIVATFGLFAASPLIAKGTDAESALPAALLAAISIGSVAAGITAVAAQKRRLAFASIAGGMSVVAALLFIVAAPRANDRFSARHIGERIGAFTKSGQAVATYRVRPGILNFYARATTESIDSWDPVEYLSRGPGILIMKKRTYRSLRASLDSSGTVLQEYSIAGENYVMLEGK